MTFCSILQVVMIFKIYPLRVKNESIAPHSDISMLALLLCAYYR